MNRSIIFYILKFYFVPFQCLSNNNLCIFDVLVPGSLYSNTNPSIYSVLILNNYPNFGHIHGSLGNCQCSYPTLSPEKKFVQKLSTLYLFCDFFCLLFKRGIVHTAKSSLSLFLLCPVV